MRRLKGERRAAQHRKAKHAPQGGTRGGQLVRMRAAKGYAGSAKRFIRGALSDDGVKRFVRIRKSTK